MRQVRSEMIANPCIPGIGAMVWKEIERHATSGIMHYLQARLADVTARDVLEVSAEVERWICGNPFMDENETD